MTSKFSEKIENPNENMKFLPHCYSIHIAEQQFTNSEQSSDFELLSIKLGPGLPSSFLSKGFKSWDLGQPVSQASSCARLHLPKLEGNHFRLGGDPADEESVIYMRLDRSSGVLNVVLIS